MKGWQRVVMVFACLGIFACANPQIPESNPPSEEQISARLVALLERQDTLMAEADVDGFLEMLLDDVVFLPPGENPVEGKSAVREYYAGLFSMFDVQLTHIPGPVDIVGDAVVHSGNARGTMSPKAGGETISFYNKYLFVMRIQPDGSLRHWRAMFNANPNAEEEPKAQ